MSFFSTHRSLMASVIAVLAAGAIVANALPAVAYPAIIGSGSSFAGIEFEQWTKDVASPPYNLNVNYQSSSSGQGRANFSDHVVDFAVTDIRYDPADGDVNPPDPSTFIYLPVTAGGVSFMYNLQKHGFTSANPIKLSSLGVCGIFTGAILFWDNPTIQASNPGVALPHIPIVPVVRSDPAGTNYVLEEYCIDLHNNLYSAFATAVSNATHSYYPDSPTSYWPILSPIEAADGSDNAADTVADPNSDGAITEVETGYALQRGFPVASVQNDTGAYVQPSDIAVATALSYATQLPDGTHELNFTPGNAAAYNPSTYSYMLIPIGSTADPNKGQTLTQFADYCLTIGQSEADRLGYASIGRQLIEFGLNRLTIVPGYVAATAAELAAVPAQQQVAAHATTQSANSSTVNSSGINSSASKSTSDNSSKVNSSNVNSNVNSSSDSSSTANNTASNDVSSAGALAANPAVSLAELLGPLPNTGADLAIPLAIGLVLALAGDVWRRAARRRRM